MFDIWLPVTLPELVDVVTRDEFMELLLEVYVMISLIVVLYRRLTSR